MKKERLTIENRLLIDELLKLDYKLKVIANIMIKNSLKNFFKQIFINFKLYFYR